MINKFLYYVLLFLQCETKTTHIIHHPPPSYHHQSGHGSAKSGYTHHNIEYVQPVKVVPHGPPIAAVPVGSSGSITTSSHHSVSSGYGAPKPSGSYGAPVSSGYGAPKPSSSYGAPKPSYHAPSSTSYGAPKPSYHSTSSSYGPPKSSYQVPKPSYDAGIDSYGAPVKPSYNPPPTYSSSYSSKREIVSGGHSEHSHPFQTDFSDTGVKRDIGASHHGLHNTFTGHSGNIDLTSGTTFTSHKVGHVHNTGNRGFGQSSTTSGNRQGRRDECYCVPAAKCPADSIMNRGGSSFQDYSQLIDPRIKPNVDIIAAEEEDSIDLGAATVVNNNRAR